MTVPYVYNGLILAVHDGDTMTVELDLGFNCYARWPVRLLGMNARELAMPGGKEARDHLIGLVGAFPAVCTVTSASWDKYARVDGYVSTSAIGDLSARMVADQYAAAWNGTGPRPVPPWPIPTTS